MTTVLDVRVVTGAGGGPEKTILNSPRFLRRHGYRMLCAYLHPPGDPGFDQLKKKAEALEAPLISIPDRGPLDLRVVWQLADLCCRERVRLWHGHDYKSNALGLLIAMVHRLRLVTTLHGWVKHTSRTPIYYAIDRLSLRYYEQVIGVSPDLVAECRRAGVPKRKSMLLENGIDLSAYERTLDRAEAKRRLGFDPQKLLIGTVGRLSPEKGFDLLIEAAAGVRRRGLDVQVCIVGEGDDQARLQAMMEKRGGETLGRLAGFQPDPRPYYEAFDLFVLSSYREGLPNVLLEAMALNVPVVATSIAGIPRLIQTGENGVLVPPGQVQALEAAIETLLGDPELRRRMAAAARTTIEQRYSFAQRMDRLAALYDRMIGR